MREMLKKLLISLPKFNKVIIRPLFYILKFIFQNIVFFYEKPILLFGPLWN